MSIPRARVHTTGIASMIRNAARVMRKAKLTPVQEAAGSIQLKSDPSKPPPSIFDFISTLTDSTHWLDLVQFQYVFKCNSCGYKNKIGANLSDGVIADAVHEFKHNDGCPRIERPVG